MKTMITAWWLPSRSVIFFGDHPSSGNQRTGLEVSGRGEMGGIKAEEIVAFGNSFNDIDMLQYAGLGIVVDNAFPEIKEIADLVTNPTLKTGWRKR